MALWLTISSSAGGASDLCERQLFPISNSSRLSGLADGEQAYGEAPKIFAVDDQTAEDLNLRNLSEMLDPYLYTDIGRKRWRHQVHNPSLDPVAITNKQKVVQYVADHPDEFAEIREHIRKVSRYQGSLVEPLREIAKEQDVMSTEILYAGMTYGLILLPQIGKLFIHEISYLIQLIFGTWGTASGLLNAMKNVGPKRRELLRYRDQFVTAKLAVQQFGRVDRELMPELHDQLNVIYAGELPERFGKLTKYWIRLNSYFNPEDRDLLIESSSKEDVERAKGLAHINRALRLLQKTWTARIPFTEREFPIWDVTTKADSFHISNFWLPKVQALIVDHKEEFASLYSALADCEVILAMADYYNAHREHLHFPDILPAGSPPQLTLKQAHHPLIAVERFNESIPNDIQLGRTEDGVEDNKFTISVSDMGEGTTTYQETAALNQILAQNGMPLFIDSGCLTPGVIMTALELKHSVKNDVNFATVETRRWNEIFKLRDLYPYSFVYIGNPFAQAGEIAGISLRIATVRNLVQGSTLGILSTRSRIFLSMIRTWKGVNLIRLQDRRIQPFNYETDKIQLLPSAYFSMLGREGIPLSIVEDAQNIYGHLRSQIPDMTIDRPNIPTETQ